ncbi:MAG TPA: N-6 DNA methylase, partial [Flavobacterium sp.]
PVEFISYIYEVFLSEKQKENGIYYTPKKLAQLIVDDVIKEDKIGSILDPSSGSGMFLITGYQRLLEIAQKQGLEPENNIDKIGFRTKLLVDNIFGIEKEPIAQRFTLFSLSLQIFAGINPTDIRDFISQKLKELKYNEKINLFSEYSFFKNIKCANTLNTLEKPFEDKQFSYIVGNPPFFEIPNTDEFQNEISFLNSYQVAISDDTKNVAKNIIGKSQISQCFFLKIKDWSNENTRFGFVSNSSNFYNDYSEVFQKYFYSNYGIEKIYELSRVKKILFEKAKESVVAIIFTNNLEDSIIDYYPVDLGLFSDKPFELLIIQEDKAIEIAQSELRNKQIRLRNFLVGNQFDLEFVNKVHFQNDILDNHIITLEGCKSKINNGLQIVGKEQILSEFNISDREYKKLTKEQRTAYSNKFKQKYTNTSFSKEFPSMLLKPGDLYRFGYNSNSRMYLGDISNFQRTRNSNIYALPKILINRTGKELKATVSLNNIFYNFDVYSIFLKENEDIYLYTALINSHLINYVIDLSFRKRVDGSYTKIGYDAISNIPVPRELNGDIIKQISDISKGLSEGQYEYIKKEQKLNELIYDLFELSYWEKQRVKDYFLPKAKIGRKKKALDDYKNILKEIIGFYFESPVTIEETSTDFHLIVVKISFGNSSISPQVAKTKKYLLNEIFEQNPNANFLASQEKIFGKDCVYIIKEDINKNWTETKAFEDGQDILKHLIPNKNGERIH